MFLATFIPIVTHSSSGGGSLPPGALTVAGLVGILFSLPGALYYLVKWWRNKGKIKFGDITQYGFFPSFSLVALGFLLFLFTFIGTVAFVYTSIF